MRKKLTNKSVEAVGLSDEVLESMRPMKELDPAFVKKFKAAKRGRPAGRSKSVVSISIDRDLLDILRESGSGWQSRINELLRAAIGLR